MKVPLGHFDVTEHDSPESIASALLSRLDRIMDAEGEAMEPETKHADHDQSTHGNWAQGGAEKFRLSRPAWAKDERPLTITPGVVDQDAIDAFSAGHCHSMAYALHERTGWPVVGHGPTTCGWDSGCTTKVHSPDAGEVCVNDQIDHLGVLSPDGNFVDVRGARPVSDVLGDAENASGFDQQMFTAPDTLRAVVDGNHPEWKPLEMEAAESVVDAVLEDVVEAKHADHDQSSHGSWARDVLDSLADAAVRVDAADFDGYDVTKSTGIPPVEDTDIVRRANEHVAGLLPAQNLWDEEGNPSPNPEYPEAVAEHYDKVPFGLFPEFRGKVRQYQTDVSHAGTEKYVRMLDEAEDFDAPLLEWDPETDTYVVGDGYHRLVAMIAGGMNLFDVWVPKDSTWAKAMREGI